MSALPADQRAAISAVNDKLLAVADLLPLIVRDQFANNDYAWPQGTQTFDGGSKCSWTLGVSTYDMAVHSADGPSFCRTGLEKVATDFVLTLDAQVQSVSNSDVVLNFRYTDEQHHYALAYSPQTQMMWMSFVGPDGEAQIFPPQFFGEIRQTGSNQIKLLAVGSNMLVSVNGALVVAVFNETRITSAGQFRVRLMLNQSNADEVLSLTRFELRGS